MKLIIIIDCQYDFISGPLGSSEAIKVKDNLKEYLASVDEDTYVIFTQDTHCGDYLETQEGKNLPIPHCMYGTKGWEVDKELIDAIKSNKYHFCIKHQFCSLTLADEITAINRKYGPIEEIIFCGLVTNICLINNTLMAKACFPEMLISVISNCCAGTSSELHQMALKVMESCQIKILDSYK